MENTAHKARQIVDQMFNNDPFSQWLGIQRLKDAEGENLLQLKVRKEMLNGFGIVHGAIAFALADSALAFAANSHGRQCLSVENSISYLGPCKEGDVLIAHATEEHCSHKIGIYKVEVSKKDGEKVALFKGTVYRSSREWKTEE